MVCAVCVCACVLCVVWYVRCADFAVADLRWLSFEFGVVCQVCMQCLPLGAVDEAAGTSWGEEAGRRATERTTRRTVRSCDVAPRAIRTHS